MDWWLQRIEDGQATSVGTLPGEMSVGEVEITLQRLLCTRMTEAEVIAASLRKEAGAHSEALARRTGVGPVTCGDDRLRYTATHQTTEGAAGAT